MSYLKKPPQGDGCRLVAAVEDATTAKEFPALMEFVSMYVWDDGSPRETGTFTLMVDGGLWKLCLNDRDASRSAFVSGATLKEAFLAAERGLVRDTLGWRPWKAERNGSRKK